MAGTPGSIVARGTQKVLKQLGVLATWITTVAAAAFILHQYLDAKWKARIEHSLDYAILYQGTEKVQALNSSNLIDAHAVLRPPASTVPTGVAGGEEAAIEPAAGPDAAGAPALVFGNIPACEAMITRYIDHEVDAVRPGWQKGKTEKEIAAERRSLYAELGGHASTGDIQYYYYAEPNLTRGLFYPFPQEGLWDEAEHTELIAACAAGIATFEADAASFQPSMIDRLHELKHFYAAVSICTQAYICDSRVSCEMFYGDVWRFAVKWGYYFEAWSASEKESEYWYLPDFIEHCQDNARFFKISNRTLKGTDEACLYSLGYFNYWRSEDWDCGVVIALVSWFVDDDT